MKSLILNGSNKHSHQLRFCDKCERRQPPEGGIAMGNGRWYCAGCWMRRNHKEKSK